MKHWKTATVLATAVALTACGNLAEKATETAIEKAAEGAGGTAADIDLEEGSLTVEGSEGSFTAQQGSLPDDWPADLPMPSDYTVESATSQSQGDEAFHQATLRVDAPAEDVVAELESALESAGWTIGLRNEHSSDGQRLFQLGASHADHEDRSVSFSVVDGGDQTRVILADRVGA